MGGAYIMPIGWDIASTDKAYLEDCGRLVRFMESTNLGEMAPHGEIAISGTGYCLADPGGEYAIYLPNGGSVTVDLSDATGTLDVDWYDPKDGTYYDEGTVTGGGSETFIPPFSGDAVLYIYLIDSTPDTTPPSAATDLAASDPTSYSIALTWTAPGDDGNSGTAFQYDIRYSTVSEISEANWNAATQCTGEPNPQIAGSDETFTVTDLPSTATYYFALKAADEVPKWSGISNCVNETTIEETNLAAEWHLDEGSGPTAADTSGNGNDGTLVNNPAWVNGKIGNALEFDGTNDYVDCGQDSSLKITGAITVEAWVNWTGTGNPYFVTKSGDSGYRSYDLSGNDDGTVVFRVGGEDCNTRKASGTISIPAGEWVHLAGTYEPSSYVRLFVNGALAKENIVGQHKPATSCGPE
jgi:hypothetical protein